MNKVHALLVRSGMSFPHFLVLASLAIGRLGAAEPVPVSAPAPAWAKDLTPATAGAYPPVPSSVLELQVSWKGLLNAGRLRMEFAPPDAPKPGFMVVRSSGKSLGAAATLFPFDSSAWSELDPASLKPKYFHAVETDRSETVTTTSHLFADRVECQETTHRLDKRPDSRKDLVFKFSPVFDIFSAMLHVRSQKLADGDRIALVIHPFNNPYLLQVNVLGHEDHLDRKTIRLSVGMRKIDTKTLELRPYKKMKREATLWLSDDADRIPVEFRAAIFIGDVRATISSFRKT